eukprot:1849822-Ditylum_brightwellii.AAC.1
MGFHGSAKMRSSRSANRISDKSLEFANHNQGNKPPPIPYYVANDMKKLSLSDYQTYKLRTNPKDEKSA